MISYNISIDYVIVDNLTVDKMFVDKIPVAKFTRHNSCRWATGKITVHLRTLGNRFVDELSVDKMSVDCKM